MKVIIVPTSSTNETPHEYGIYGNCVTKKGEADIMEKSQESIRNRFGYANDESENSEY